MQLTLFDSNESNLTNKYSRKCSAPQYVPSEVVPDISELLDTSKYVKLLKDIKESTVTSEEKEFLIKAASRHLVFNYAQIADYYAHATPEMQRLMEQSALVIIDVNDAIVNGYVKLSKTITDIMEADDEE